MTRTAMRRGWVAGGGALSALLAVALASPAEAQTVAAGRAERSFAADAVRQPFHAVRTLGLLQERIAQGDETAFAMQRDVVQEISGELKSFPTAVWREQRNRRALIKYALSGGDPEQLRVVHAQKLFTEAERPLAEGALAYAEGQRSLALRHLERVDVFTLPPSLAGHVALVKALVLANSDLTRVIRLSDEARLLSPGTLVEETALRLAMEAAIAQSNRAKFEALASRYFRRFPRSPYLGAVIRPVAAAIVENGYGEEAEGARWVHSVVHYLDPQKLVQFYAALAEIGLREAKLATTINATRMARKYARNGSLEYAWTQAYEGAALVIGLAPEDGLALLNAAEASGVPEAVGELIAGARAISHLIRSPPPPLPASSAEAQSGAAPTRKAAAAGAKSTAPGPADQYPAAVKVQARIAQIDKMLKDIDQ
jgi:chemotaxis protein MotC